MHRRAGSGDTASNDPSREVQSGGLYLTPDGSLRADVDHALVDHELKGTAHHTDNRSAVGGRR